MKHLSLLLTIGLMCSGTALAANTPPCTLAIDSPEAFAQWKSVDANGDGGDNQFQYDANGYALYVENKSVSANDWIISPAVTLKAGTTYNITFSVRQAATYTGDKQDFTVYTGTSQDVAALTSKVFSVIGLTKTTWAVEKSGKFTATEAGDYYFGLNLTSKSYNGNFEVYSVKVEEVKVHPGAATNLSVTPAPLGALEATLTWTWPTKTDLGGDLSSVTGAYIYRGTTRTFETNDASRIGDYADPAAAPGAQASWIDKTLTEAGKYYYKVVPYNAEGASTADPACVQSPFIGPAKSISAVTELKATAVAEDVKKVELTWTAPTASDGGYLDLEAVKYKIARSKDGGSYQDLATDWSGTLPYVDATLDGLGSYTYQVRTIYNGTTSWSPATSNAVITGGTMALPYSNDFSTNNSADLLKFFTGPNGSRTWGLSSGKLSYWGGTTADAWAVLPVFTLKAGKTYKISYRSWVQKTTSPKNLAVVLGTQPTVEGMTDVIAEGAVINSLGGNVSQYFNVPADGDYYLGFHVYGASNTDDLYLDDVLVEESVTAANPVTEAKAEAAPAGALQAMLSWINPNKTTAGDPLSVVDKIVITRNDEVSDTITVREGGVEDGIICDVPKPGIYTYTLTVYLGDVASEPVTVTTPWIGFDTPKAPATVEAAISGDNRVITFAAVTEGVHGGYIDVPNLRYVVSRNDVVLSTEVKGSPYTDDEQGLPLAIYTYSVKAVNGEYPGEATESNKLTIGDALALPFHQDFNSAADFDLWDLSHGSWIWDNTKKGLRNGTSDSYAFTPPILMKKGECKLTFKATCYNARNEEDIQIYLVKAVEVPLPADAQTIGDFHVNVVNWPDAVEQKFTVPETGTYYVAFGQKKSAFYAYLQALDIEQVSENNENVGIDAIGADSLEGARYFTLQGVELKEPVKGQPVIVVTGEKSFKAIFK